MIELLSRLLIKNRTAYTDPNVRSAYGTLCGAMGIFFNLCLFAGKFLAGSLSGSVSITADAFNNLSDAGSSLVSLIGFKLSAQKPDPEHPFGHGRFEYVSSLIISMIILVMGYELGKESVSKIRTGSEAAFSLLSFLILGASILVKLYMFSYNRRMGRKLDSATLRATAADSLSDCVSTGAVLICGLISLKTGLNLDGWVGCAVALLILYAGFSCARETINLMLGTPPEEEFIRRISNIVLSHEGIVGIHDMIVHNYGPGREYCSLHAEVPADGDILEIHDLIDNIEKDILEETGCLTTIHMDPVDTGEKCMAMKQMVRELLDDIDPGITFHDFRIVDGPTHTNLIFDVVLPFRYRLSDEEVKRRIGEKLSEQDGKLFAVLTIDHDYAGGVC